MEVRYASFSADEKKLAYSKGRRTSNVWRVPILEDRPATWADGDQITSGHAFIEFLDLSPDGDRLLVSSNRAGNPDLWILPSEGGSMRSVTTDPTPDWLPSWSSDGEEIAFYAYRSGNRDIWLMPAEGGPARQITKHPERDSFPVWSPDGQHIAFDSYRAGNEDFTSHGKRIWGIFG